MQNFREARCITATHLVRLAISATVLLSLAAAVSLAQLQTRDRIQQARELGVGKSNDLASVDAQSTAAAQARLRKLALAAEQAQAQRDFRSAERYYEEILRICPGLAEGWANLGLMHQFLGEYEQANRDFEEALRKNPALYVPNLFWGLNLLRAHQIVAAVHLLEKAEKLQPNDERAVLGLGSGLEAMGNYAKAIELFNHATAIKPRDPDAWYALGVAYLYLQNSAVVQLKSVGRTLAYTRSLVAEAFLQQGRVNDAITIYKALLKSFPQPPCILSALGFAYSRQGSLALAGDAFQRQLQRDLGCLSARVGLAHVALAKGDLTESLKQLHIIWRADHRFFESNLSGFLNGLNREQIIRFESWLKQCSLQGSDDGFAYVAADYIDAQSANTAPSHLSKQHLPSEGMASDFASGKLISHVRQSPQELWEQGHYTACETMLKEREPRLSPTDLGFLARCAYYAGDFRTSLLASQAILALNPRSAMALYWEAKSSVELGREALARMGHLAPDSSKVHLILGQLYRETHQFARAEREYAKVLEAEPNNPAAHLGLANLYDQEFIFQRAMAHLGAVLHTDPGNPEANFLMGKILTNLHQYIKATPYLKAALQDQSVLAPEIASLLARCYSAQGRVLDAIEELRPALAADPTGVFHYQLYRLYEKAGNHKAATDALRESEMLRSKSLKQRQELLESLYTKP